MGEERGITDEPLEPLIHLLRGQRVILDADLARLYGVTTKSLNQAIKRNAERFPRDFAFQLTIAEAAEYKSAVTAPVSERPDFKCKNPNRSQIVTGSQRHRDPRLPPWAFSEHGALMAANVLRSPSAVRMSVFVVRAFVRLREQAVANAAILRRLAEIDQTLLQHDSALRDLYRKLQPLLAPPPGPPKRR
ncbi:MAG TPA: ORF6N domain-containing protein, partial [Burkholderiales bacterium]